ncbi:MAG: cation-translocating P-type ATPase [Proteobacteria bacterium]|nr:cation-translocating P-type ATPase [Pseudomonadota bacterium]
MANKTLHGLTQEEAAARLERDGYNELPSAKPSSLFGIAAKVVCEPMFLLLIACGAIYLLLGDRTEALMLLGFVLVVVGISFFQERKTERALDALRDLSSPRALVMRDGELRRIAGREVVRGDLLVLAEGDRVPADAVLLSGMNLSADESLLTGESVPVRKAPALDAPESMGKPGGDDLPFLYSGTMVVQGKGLAQTLATGQHTALGSIGKALAAVEQEPTRIQIETARVVKRLAWLGFGLSLAVAIAYALLRGDWLNGFLVGITLAMAILPEELPVVMTIFLGLGAWRIAQQRVLTRHIPAVEMLGSATVLCVDKTGTLTQNRMALAQLQVRDRVLDLSRLKGADLPEQFHELLEFSMLASHRDPFDPMEKAIGESARAALADTEHIHGDWNLIEEYALSSALLAVSRVWQSPDRELYVIAAKGAPEAIADLCHLGAEDAVALEREVTAMAAQGLRVLGVAKASFAKADLPAIQHDFNFAFLGLIGLADPVRDSVPAAIGASHAAGMRVIMITGDYPATAVNIAQQIGLESPTRAITGAELDAMDDAELARRVRDVNVFCRAAPEHKLRLVSALKANGAIVAMTGDGVNDAPALKAAHIGIAMGARGTDVARESAALVLLDDDFTSIVAAVRLGRRIFDNLRKAIAFVIAAHVPIVGMSLIPVAMGWPLVLLPVHILFLQLIIDPACSIVFEAEPEEADVMRRAPRPSGASLFERGTVVFGLLQGFGILAIVAAVFAVALYRGQDAATARALTFTAMVIADLGLILSNRSSNRSFLATLGASNRALWWVIAGALTFLGLVLYVPLLRDLFHFGYLHADDILIAVAAGAVCILGVEAAKLMNRPDARPVNASGVGGDVRK